MKLISVFVFAFSSLASALYPTSLIHQFPADTWLENLAVRPSGSVLVTTWIPDASLYEIDPQAPPGTLPKLVNNFSSSLTATGITEGQADTFYVATNNATIITMATPAKSNKIWRVAYPGPKIELVGHIEQATVLNGLTTLNSHTILAADCVQGSIYSVNTNTGAYKRIISGDPLMARNANSPLGINGIKVLGKWLYFTNTAQELTGRIRIRRDGTPIGRAVKVASSSTVPVEGFEMYDDLAIDEDGRSAYAIVGGGNVVQKISLPHGDSEVVAGNLNSTDLAEPTAIQFGRTTADKKTLYVTTAGAFAVPIYQHGKRYQGIGGQLVAVKMA